MKILIIDESILGQVLVTLLSQHKHSIILNNHEDALESLLLEEPDAVLICECWKDAANKTINVSKTTLEDIRNSTDKNVTVKTLGFDGMAFDETCDILINPLTIETLLQSLEE